MKGMKRVKIIIGISGEGVPAYRYLEYLESDGGMANVRLSPAHC